MIIQQTTQFKFCTKDYITTMYPARGQFLLKVKMKSSPTLWPRSLPGSSVHGIFQARILEWVAISFSRQSSQPRDQTLVSHIIGRCSTIWATREVFLPENMTNPVLRMHVMGVGLVIEVIWITSINLINLNPFILKCELWQWIW